MKKPTFTMRHIGINGKDRDEAVQIVTLFSSIFDLELRTEKKGSPLSIYVIYPEQEIGGFAIQLINN